MGGMSPPVPDGCANADPEKKCLPRIQQGPAIIVVKPSRVAAKTERQDMLPYIEKERAQRLSLAEWVCEDKGLSASLKKLIGVDKEVVKEGRGYDDGHGSERNSPGQFIPRPDDRNASHREGEEQERIQAGGNVSVQH